MHLMLLLVSLCFVVGSAFMYRKPIKALLLDCDGVLWKGPNPIKNSIESLIYLQKEHPEIKVLYVTNNSIKTRKEIRSKFFSFGIVVNEDDIITSGSVTAAVLHSLEINKVLMIGNPALKDEMEQVNIVVHDLSSSEPAFISENEFDNIFIDPTIKAVCLGWDTQFTSRKLCLSSLYLQREECKFFVTNLDAYDMTPSANRFQH